jgi:hypothetical protein
MLRQEDILMEIGRCEGGSFVRVVHTPTGISRRRGPLRGANVHELLQVWLQEIENELRQLGLVQHIISTTD